MAIVYVCVEDSSQKLCAVKTIRSDLRFDEASVARFNEEARLHAQVNSEHIVSILASDTQATPPWIALEYLEDHNLARTVAVAGPMMETRLIELAHALSQGLLVVHRVGIVHRDIKPDNIVLTTMGPKLLDFGIARSSEGSSLTRENSFVGSRIWASPEQLRREKISEKTDVFSLGQVIGFAGTGRPPFGDGSSEAEVAAVTNRILYDPPDLAGLSRPLQEVLLSALQKDAGRRPSVEELCRHFSAMSETPRTSLEVDSVHSRTSWQSFVSGVESRLDERVEAENARAVSVVRESWATQVGAAQFSTGASVGELMPGPPRGGWGDGDSLEVSAGRPPPRSTERYFVDGFVFSRRHQPALSLQEQRKWTSSLLDGFARSSGCQVTVVFDRLRNDVHDYGFGGGYVSEVCPPYGFGADEMLLRLLEAEDEPEVAWLVTDDRDLAEQASEIGVNVLSTGSFVRRLV